MAAEPLATEPQMKRDNRDAFSFAGGAWPGGAIPSQKQADFEECGGNGHCSMSCMKPMETAAGVRKVVEQTCPLSGLAVGSRGRVVCVCGEVDARRRLLEMGFCNGAMVETIRRAPFGDPIEYRLRGYCLSLREQQACCVTVTPADE
jgi:ferrous iron transport protein A